MKEIRNPFKRELIRKITYYYHRKYYDDKLLERCYKEIDILEEKEFLQLSILLYEYLKQNGYDYQFIGSTNNLFIFYVLDLTDINPLPPHHYCKHCKHIDYENEICPKCHKVMGEDGYNLPSEEFDGIIRVKTCCDFPLLIDFKSDMERNEYYVVRGISADDEQTLSFPKGHYLFIPMYCSNDDVLLKVGESGMLETVEDFLEYIGRFPIISIE